MTIQTFYNADTITERFGIDEVTLKGWTVTFSEGNQPASMGDNLILIVPNVKVHQFQEGSTRKIEATSRDSVTVVKSGETIISVKIEQFCHDPDNLCYEMYTTDSAP